MKLCEDCYSFLEVFDQDEIEEIIKYVEKDRMRFGTTGGDKESRDVVLKQGSDVRKSKVHFINRNKAFECEPLQKYYSTMEYANKKYFFKNLTEPEGFQYTEYDESYQGFYKIHRDTDGRMLRSRMLSASLQLTDPSEYEGGDLIIYKKDNEKVIAPKSLGTITVFTSSTLHEVTPVTKGFRSSLVVWYGGTQ